MNFIENIKQRLNKVSIFIIMLLLILSTAVPTALVLWGVYELVLLILNKI
jgi:hypothetical protein